MAFLIEISSSWQIAAQLELWLAKPSFQITSQNSNKHMVRLTRADKTASRPKHFVSSGSVKCEDI